MRLSTSVDGAFLELSSKFGLEPATGGAAEEGGGGGLPPRPSPSMSVRSAFARMAYRQALEFCRDAVEMAGVELGGFDVGGGLPAPYPACPRRRWTTISRHPREARKTLRLSKKADLICELG